jgi:hypothetical protein
VANGITPSGWVLRQTVKIVGKYFVPERKLAMSIREHDLLIVAKCALADLQGLLASGRITEYDSGSPPYTTVRDLFKAIRMYEPDYTGGDNDLP